MFKLAPVNGQKRAEGVQAKDFGFKIEAISETGEFEGYASVFGNVDSYREIVAPGAFAESIEQIKSDGSVLPALWNHNSSEPIGFYQELEEDEVGLRVKGRLLVGEVKRASEIAALGRAGAVSGLSIGYWEQGDEYDEETRIRTLTKLKLREVSWCTFPANELARVETIKMKLAGGTLPSVREFERLLRDAGFSKSVAARIAARGYSDLEGRRDADLGSAAVNEELRAQIARFAS